MSQAYVLYGTAEKAWLGWRWYLVDVRGVERYRGWSLTQAGAKRAAEWTARWQARPR